MSAWAPVAVGGVGGSGTRVVAAILKEAGIRIGDDLNQPLDNLWFTLLFKHRGILDAPDDYFGDLVSIFIAAMTGGRPATARQLAPVDELAREDRLQHESCWLQARAASLRRAIAAPSKSGPWAWKEPNTHMVVDRLAARIPGLKYIHVARNGLDMAHSTNQNQLRLWGPAALSAGSPVNPRNSLRFWCWAHSRIMKIGESLGPRFLLVRFEELCAAPRAGVRSILSFAGVGADPDLLDRAMALVEPPATIGRHRDGSMGDFHAEDVAFVRSFGFECN